MGYNIAFSGLTAAAEAIDVTSNNIANSQTVGYKAGQYVFADQFFRAQDPQSKDRSGMGTNRQVIRRDQNYGTVTGTQNPLDLALTGPGMFVLAKQASNNVPTETPSVFQYSRNGQFGVDSQNRIVNESGMFAVGYPASPDGQTVSQASFSVLSLDPTPKSANPSTTSTIALNINNGGNPIQSPFDPNNSASYTQSTSQTVYDSSGNSHTMSNFYVKQAPATLYLYPQNGGGTRTGATVFSFNPKQDISSAADNFSSTQNLTGVGNGVSSDQSIATTSVSANAGTNETLQGVTLTPMPAGQTSTYQMKLSDGTTLIVTAQPGLDGTGNPVTRYAYAADRYKVYSTVDGVVVNRNVAVTSQVAPGYNSGSTYGSLVGAPITVSGAVLGSIAAGSHTYTFSVPSPTVGGSAATLTVTTATSGPNNQITAATISGGTGFTPGATVHITGAQLGGRDGTGDALTINLIAGTNVTTSTVSSLSVGGAIQGSAPAGSYTYGSTTVTGALNGTIIPSGSVTGGVAGIYTVPLLSNGAGTGGIATINYGGNGVINSIQLSGGQGYTTDTVTIPAGSLGSGSSALSIGAITGQTYSGTFLTMHDLTGSPILSSQPIVAGSVSTLQTFTFSNGISVTLNTPATESEAAIAASLNNKVVAIENQPLGIMGFVAGKNIDSLARDNFGVPAFTTQTSISTTVGSGTRVNQLALNIDSTDMTAYSASAQTYKSTTNGNPLSQLTGYTFSNKGELIASYDDGTTLIKGQLAIASFNNTEGLIPVGLNSFQVSGTTGTTSGAAMYGTANSGNLGAVQGKAVESSNVDLTAELVKLMTLQRLYTANSQAVKIEAATIVDDAIRIGQ
jgi:flagellar hook-basal body protein